MKKLAKLLLVVMLVSAFALVLTACTKTDCELGKHDFTGTETVTKEATCTEKGSKTIKCKNCDETTTVEIDALGHDYAGAWTVVAGKHSQKCSRCDSTTTHDPDMGAWAVVEGKHVQTCSKCSVKGEHNANFDETITANVTIQDSTCIAKGSKTVKCKDCTLTDVSEIDMKAHDYDETTLVCKTTGCNAVSPEAKVSIGEKHFKTLAAAVASVTGTEKVVIKVDANHETPGVMIAESRAINVEIDLNGKTVTVVAPNVGSAGTESQSMHFEKGNTVVIKNGKIEAKAESTSAMLVQNYCNLTLDKVTLDGSNLRENSYTLSNNFGTIAIKNGSKIIARATKGVAFDLWYGMSAAYDNGITVTVADGCTITGAIEYGAHSRVTGTDWIAKTALTLPAGIYDVVYTNNAVTDANANITIGGKKIGAIAAVAHAYVSNKKEIYSVHETYDAAYTAAVSYCTAETDTAQNATITVLKDATVGGMMLREGNVSLTIDLNGHTLTVGKPLVGSTGTVSQSMHFEKGNTVTIKNGTINCENNSASMLLQNYCNLTLDGVTLDGSNLAGSGTAYTLSNNFGKVVIKGGSEIIARAEKGVAFDLWYGMSAAYEDGISVVVESGTVIDGTIEYGAHSRVTGTAWIAKTSLVLPVGTYDIKYTSTNVTAETANITYATAVGFISSYAAEEGWTNGTKYGTVEMEGLFKASTVDAGSNTGKYYVLDDSWRMYQTENPSVKLEAATGKIIKSVIVYYISSNDGVIVNGETKVASGTAISVNGATISLTIGNTGTKTNGQVRITAIAVIVEDAPAAPQA